MSIYLVTPSPTCSSVEHFNIVCDTYYQARDVQQQLLSNYRIISIVTKVEM